MRTKEYTLAVLLLSALMAFFLVPSVAAAVEQPGSEEQPAAAEFPVGGHTHVDVDIYHVPGEDSVEAHSESPETLPAKWDPRVDKPWYKDKIQVKYQGKSNICWACAAATAAEVSYSKETNGSKNDTLSPYQIAYFYYNRENDPLGNTGGDENNPNPDSDWNWSGGACVNTFQHLATRSGMIPDSPPASLKDLTDYYETTQTPAPSIDDKTLAYDHNLLTMEDCEYHYDLPYNKKGMTTLKRMITEHGAAVASIQVDSDHSTPGMDEGYFKGGDAADPNFYKPDEYDPANGNYNDHEVTIVGWDDNYSKDNFGSWNKETGKYDAKPKNDGAWIMQNSWSESYGDSGYYYISYESADVLSDGILSMDMEPAEADSYLFQYDGNAVALTATMEPGEKAANIFRAPENQQIIIDRVSFTEFNEGPTDYVIDIYTGLEDPKDPASGCKAMSSQMFSTYTPGYKTCKLNQPVTVDPGESWSAVITFKGTTKISVECAVVKDGYTYYSAGISEGQSFYYDTEDRSWADTAIQSDEKFCFRIKGVASASPYAACEHQYLPTNQSYAPTKNEGGYTVYQCTQCGHKTMMDLEPMLQPVPEKTNITSLTASDKAFTVKWSKNSELIRNKHITGYQIRYGLKSDMSSSKTIAVSGWNTVSKKVTGLQEGKQYYVQVRPFFKLDDSTYQAPWSAKKSVKTPAEKKSSSTAKKTTTKKTSSKKQAKVTKIDGAAVVLSSVTFTYNGKVLKPTIKTIGKKTLKAGTDYTVKIKNSKGTVVASPKAAGNYTMLITGKGKYSGSAKATFRINKAANRLKVEGKKAKVNYKKLKKQSRSLGVSKVITVTQKGQGKMSYRLVSAKKGKKSFKKYFKVNASTGTVKIKKKLKKGTYTVKVQVKAAGTANYKASAWKAVTFKVQVK